MGRDLVTALIVEAGRISRIDYTGTPPATTIIQLVASEKAGRVIIAQEN